ncbi:uncharacterized protein si:ch211-67e16.3 isoform X2 [Neoarius graeffei]|uniref:uncharacterized protein si:ch211-67e16.3 isoform X2 n=1 Tax=Neoarius graeffei TaxID=443677 RepID=UPI00298BF516|nr:uncharacterized protein si:ch211-67e16.3 isoform X2 [Neoarius graeffei]
MSDIVFTLLLSLSLTLHIGTVCAGFNVSTLLQYNFTDNSVNIICQHNAPEAWIMEANLLINGENVCKTDKSNTACEQRKEGNQIIFPVKITAEHKYSCLVYRSSPMPLQTRNGKEITFSPGCEIPSPTPTNSSDCAESNVCPRDTLPGLHTWALLGIVFLLCLYSLIITAVYTKLRNKISEELTITYVPMQQTRIRPKKVKGHGADKNAEYMDMREVHHKKQPIRDMNHNSRLTPVGFTV